MKLTNITPIFPTFESLKREDITAVSTDSKVATREIIQHQINKMQEIRNEKGEDNPKVQQIMNKFKNGEKLSPDELAYIAKHAPGHLDDIQKTLQKREIMERRMEVAPTKVEVQLTVIQTIEQLEKTPNDQERELLMKHLKNAKKEYEKTDDYKEKPDTPMNKKKNTTPFYREEPIPISYRLAIEQYKKQLL